MNPSRLQVLSFVFIMNKIAMFGPGTFCKKKLKNREPFSILSTLVPKRPNRENIFGTFYLNPRYTTYRYLHLRVTYISYFLFSKSN